jgi:tripartite-type tricarboxylate transporter receptor subunit TctC
MALMRIIAAVATLIAAAAPAPAQDWPTRPVTIIVPFAAGGAFDVMARVFSPQLTQILGQQVIVENIGAAAGTVGTSRAAKAAPDGYTVLLGSVGTPSNRTCRSPANAYNPSLYKKLPYNAATDFAPVALIAEQPMVLLTRKTFPPTRCRSSSPM